MYRSRWLHNLFGLPPARRDRRRQAAQTRQPIRPMLESLEERLTPSANAPTQTAGSYATLNSDVAADTATNTNYVIDITSNFTFTSGNQVNIWLSSGSTLTIEGQNGNNFTLTGNGNRLFNIMGGSSESVTFQDLTLTGGTVSTSNRQGGAIYDYGDNVTLNKVDVKGNSVTGSAAQGGGVFVSSGQLVIQGGSVIQSNRATGRTAQGGGVYALDDSIVSISDSTFTENSARGSPGANAVTAGANGGSGGDAAGGGLYVAGHGFTTILGGDTFTTNTATGGGGGNGAGGASGSNPGDGGGGGAGGSAQGGAAFFSGSLNSSTLKILNDSTDPSIFLGNSVQSGAGGRGGDGGLSSGSTNSNGGIGGAVGAASGGAIFLTQSGGTLNANIGNTALYGNTVTGGSGGMGGNAGIGGSGAPGMNGANMTAGGASGGAVGLASGNLVMVNSTVAQNTVTAGDKGGTTTQGAAIGGGVADNSSGTVTLDDNTVTLNALSGIGNAGSGIAVGAGNPTLINNLIQNNQSTGSTAFDLDTDETHLSSATNNFIGTISSNAVSTTSNIVGNTQTQLGSVVGVNGGGNASGGPIYYPLLSGVASLNAGNTSVLSTIAGVEGTSTANATDEIGNLRSADGIMDLGAVQASHASSSPSPSPSSSPSPAHSLVQEVISIALDSEALLFLNDPSILAILNGFSERLLGQPLPPASELIPTIEADFAALLSMLRL